MEWPPWWSWELELSPHLLKRMIDRGFNEVDLRGMLETATGYDPAVEPGRWVVRTRYGGEGWQVVVEPIQAEGVLLVITAFAIES
jgi:hypothetical protein